VKVHGTAAAVLPPEKLAEFRRAILSYYNDHGRAFPWRETSDPWAILVSEFMLQQTQTARVTAKYSEWMARFPTPESLASAPLAEALRYWSGLGYNRRARNLRRSAEIIATEGFPGTAEGLLRLPGAGPYTARAVAAFAFNAPEVFIETNIRSVFIFFFFPGVASVPDSAIAPLVRGTLDAENPRRWYYALMDYGAALKKKTPNPSRRSASYAKQSPFRGSVREARGAVLRALSSGVRSALTDIAEAEDIERERLEQAAVMLAAEGLIVEEGGAYRIA